ncbi:MAG: tetratricopeptide repeat protein, partial [Pyrinomonadaceae bacterium]
SYPIASAPAAKEEYRYDGKGNIIEMTLRSDDGAILSREVYDYEFDRFGNWKKMVTSLVVFEAGELKREPVEVTYRTLTYYFDDAVAGMIHPASQQTMPAIPAPRSKSLIDDIPPIALKKTGGLPQTGPSVSFLSESPPDAPPPVENQVPPTVVAEKDTSALSVKTRGPSLSSSAARVPSVETAKVIAPAGSLNEANAVKSASALYRAGRVSFDSGDLKEAVTAYLQSLELEPNSAEVNLSLGHAYLKLKKSKEAAKAFKQAIILNPDLSEAHYGLGLHYYGLKLYQEAARAFKQATALSPDMAKAHFGLALSYQEMRDHNGLMSEYRILQRLDRALAKKLADSFPVFNLLPCRAAPFCK